MEVEKFRDTIAVHLTRYPLAQIEDWYKLTHQAAFGSEHAVKDIQTAREWLNREIRGMADRSVEPLFDPISADGQIIRIHLHPYIKLKLDPELLLRAFITTANEFRGSIELFVGYWHIIENLVNSREISVEPGILSSFTTNMKAAGYPAVHHSMQYLNAYHPHYRVVAKKFLPSEIVNKSG